MTTEIETIGTFTINNSEQIRLILRRGGKGSTRWASAELQRFIGNDDEPIECLTVPYARELNSTMARILRISDIVTLQAVKGEEIEIHIEQPPLVLFDKEEVIAITRRYKDAIIELLEAEAEMISIQDGFKGSDWYWGRCEVGDLADRGCLSFTFGSKEDMPDDGRGRFGVIFEEVDDG